MKILNLKKLFKTVGLYLTIIFLLIFSNGCSVSVSDILSFGKLKGDDLAAYELITEVSYEFKNPSSLRLISGTVHYDEEDKEYSGWFAISATNGFGATTVGYYFVSYLDGEIYALDLEEYGTSSSISYAKERDELDVDKINKEIEKYWNK